MLRFLQDYYTEAIHILLSNSGSVLSTLSFLFPNADSSKYTKLCLNQIKFTKSFFFALLLRKCTSFGVVVKQ